MADKFDGEPIGWDDRKDLAELWQEHCSIPITLGGADPFYRALIAVANYGFHRGVEQAETGPW